jgi:hypothetical protein
MDTCNHICWIWVQNYDTTWVREKFLIMDDARYKYIVRYGWKYYSLIYYNKKDITKWLVDSAHKFKRTLTAYTVVFLYLEYVSLTFLFNFCFNPLFWKFLAFAQYNDLWVFIIWYNRIGKAFCISAGCRHLGWWLMLMDYQEPGGLLILHQTFVLMAHPHEVLFFFALKDIWFHSPNYWFRCDRKF